MAVSVLLASAALPRLLLCVPQSSNISSVALMQACSSFVKSLQCVWESEFTQLKSLNSLVIHASTSTAIDYIQLQCAPPSLLWLRASLPVFASIRKSVSSASFNTLLYACVKAMPIALSRWAECTRLLCATADLSMRVVSARAAASLLVASLDLLLVIPSDHL